MAWMPKTICFVDACYLQPRMRCQAARKLGGKPVLEWIVRAATDAQRVDGVVVVTSSEPGNELVDRLVPPDIPVFHGPSRNPLECFVAGIERFGAEAALRLPGTWPFVDSVILDNLVLKAEEFAEVDYVAYSHSDGTPASSARLGLLPEWFRASTLRRLAQRLKGHLVDDLTELVRQFPRRFRVRHVPLPAEFAEEELYPLFTEECCWEVTETLWEALGPEVHNFRRVLRVLAEICQHHRHLSAPERALSSPHFLHKDACRESASLGD